MVRSARFVVLCALIAAGAFASQPARADGPAGMFSVDQGTSTIAYTIHHPLHTVTGVSKKVLGKAKLNPDGSFLVQVEAPVNSFDSGSSGRDEHMQETMEAPQYPNVMFKGRGNVTMPTSFPSTQTFTVKGDLDFHGRRHEESIPVKLTFTSPTQVHVTSHFAISLDKYEVKRPSLFLVKIDDACKIALDLTMKQ